MMLQLHKQLVRLFLMGWVAVCVHAQQMPPANVNVAEIRSGSLSPTQNFKGTVYFKEVSNVASEIPGKVVEVLYEEGDHLAEGAPMVRLDDSLLQADLAKLQAEVHAAEALLQQEQSRYERMRVLHEREVATPQSYDDTRFTVEAVRFRLAAAKAQATRLEEEIRKKTITAPYDGVVLLRESEKGDWKEEGDSVAVFARKNLYDVILQIPERHLPYLKPGMPLAIEVLGQAIEGKLANGSPRGDPATRTFPIRIRVEGNDWLLEGMSAEASIPTGETVKSLLVPRDAVLMEDRQFVVYTVQDGQAVRHEVEIVGVDGARTMGIQGEGLTEGMNVIVKGHERLRPGQPLNILAEAPPQAKGTR